jgi:hypothetical protein
MNFVFSARVWILTACCRPGRRLFLSARNISHQQRPSSLRVDDTSDAATNRRQRRAAAFGAVHASPSIDTRHGSQRVSPNAQQPGHRPSKSRGGKAAVKQRHVLKTLEPHVLSTRISRLSDRGLLDEAIALVKNAPLDAQNTPVWNTLIWECLKARRYQLGFKLYAEVGFAALPDYLAFSSFVQMRRRGFLTTTRTYQTMLNGLNRIEHWGPHTKQLVNAHSLFKSYRDHIAYLKQHKPDSPELVTTPTAAYFSILGENHMQQRMFDIYYTLEQDGPLAPNAFLYAVMFKALTARKGTSTEAAEKNASNAKLLWSLMLKAKQPIVLDTTLVTSAIGALTHGRASEHRLAFSLVAQHFGLTEEDAMPPEGESLPLSKQALSSILTLCNATKNYPLTFHFFEEVKKRPQKLGNHLIIDRHHCEQVLDAYRKQATTGYANHSVQLLEWMIRQDVPGWDGKRVQPTRSTYISVFHSCWGESDWQSAVQTFELMTGYHMHDFMDGSVRRPRISKRLEGQNMELDPEALSMMLRIALATQNHAHMRQCLRLVDFVLLKSELPKLGVKTGGHKLAKSRQFFSLKLGSAIQGVVEEVLSKTSKYDSEKERQAWRVLSDQARASVVRMGDASSYLEIIDRTGKKSTAQTHEESMR